MVKWWQAVLFGLAGLVIGIAGTYLLTRGSQQMAVVDMSRLLKESAPAKELTAKLNAQAKSLEDAIGKITNAQEKASKTAQYQSQLSRLNQDYTAEVVAKVDPVLKQLAKKHGAQAVFVKDAVRYANIDLTEEALAELGK